MLHILTNPGESEESAQFPLVCSFFSVPEAIMRGMGKSVATDGGGHLSPPLIFIKKWLFLI